jgi:hypothetical protein
MACSFFEAPLTRRRAHQTFEHAQIIVHPYTYTNMTQRVFFSSMLFAHSSRMLVHDANELSETNDDAELDVGSNMYVDER